MGFDIVDVFPFMLRLSKHPNLFQQPAGSSVNSYVAKHARKLGALVHERKTSTLELDNISSVQLGSQQVPMCS